ncbi:MAG: hypothetical protein M0020_03525 [Actinomycetota bacterium]|nr:hypothetical protein [Actinomycetota bacterium]
MSSDRLEVEALDWDTEFLPRFKDLWRPGEHVSIIAPTGEGKTVFAGGLIESCRKYALILDVKGGDTSLEEFGFPRVEKWPGHKSMGEACAKNDEEGRPSRYVIGNRARTHQDTDKLVATINQCLYDAYEMGGWTIYADELLVLTDPRQSFDLRGTVDKILVAARDRGISFVGSYQQPSWVTPMAGRQASWVVVSRNRNIDVVNGLADILGRPKAEIRGALRGLEKHHWIVVGRDASAPLMITTPSYKKRGNRNGEEEQGR